MNLIKSTLFSLITLFVAFNASTQTNTCSGTYTSISNDCQPLLIGDGTPGSIQICLNTNNIPSGGGTSCNPGGACNPPFGGGGHPAGIRIYASDGTNYTGTLLANFNAATPSGTCFTLPSSNGYAYVFGLCLTAGTTISWSTIDACGNDACDPLTPPCVLPCSTCANACGTCGFETEPTIPQVTDNCTGYAYTPSLGPSQTSTRCHQFTAVNTDVSFNVIITSNCSGGNVTNFSWNLQESGCSGIIQSGTLSNLSFTGLTVGNTYTFCYTFTVPPTCSHSAHTPYFVGAETVVLPVELLSFTGQNIDNVNTLNWSTATERNNDYFTLERSTDGINWKTIRKVSGAGTSNATLNYSFDDLYFDPVVNYYRLTQTDYDGSSQTFIPVMIDNRGDVKLIKTVNSIGQEVNESYRGLVIEYYSDGSTVKRIR